MRHVVREWERLLVHRDGRWVETLGPGAHRRPWWRREFTRVDLRPRLQILPVQEIPTADGISVKITLVAKLRIDDPRRWHDAVAHPDSFAYAALQVALRDAVAARTLDELLAARGSFGPELVTATAAALADVGLVADDVAVRDLMLPTELRHAATEAATARARGQAALERARSEVAATRALANAARLAADNPAILHLRTLQAVENGGATVVLSTGVAGGIAAATATRAAAGSAGRLRVAALERRRGAGLVQGHPNSWASRTSGPSRRRVSTPPPLA